MQQKVKNFNENKNSHKTQMPVSARLLDIESELGELAKEYLKSSKYGTKNFEASPDFKLEFGDVLYSLLSLANEVGIDAKICLDSAIDKYQKRIETSHSMGSKKIKKCKFSSF